MDLALRQRPEGQRLAAVHNRRQMFIRDRFSASAAITAYRAVGFLSLFSGFSSPRFSLLPLTTSSSVHGSQSPLSIDAELPISLPEETNHSCDTGASALYEAILQMLSLIHIFWSIRPCL